MKDYLKKDISKLSRAVIMLSGLIFMMVIYILVGQVRETNSDSKIQNEASLNEGPVDSTQSNSASYNNSMQR